MLSAYLPARLEIILNNKMSCMDVLELDDSDKSMLTRCVKKCFPESTKKIITIDKES